MKYIKLYNILLHYKILLLVCNQKYTTYYNINVQKCHFSFLVLFCFRQMVITYGRRLPWRGVRRSISPASHCQHGKATVFPDSSVLEFDFLELETQHQRNGFLLIFFNFPIRGDLAKRMRDDRRRRTHQLRTNNTDQYYNILRTHGFHCHNTNWVQSFFFFVI